MTAIPIAEMSYPTRMVVGPGALARLPGEMERLGVRRALVVSDPGLEKVGIVDRVARALESAGYSGATYLGVSKNPVERDVLDGVQAYREAEADVIIGLGGGAPMDVAKVISLKVTHELDLEAYDDLKDGWKLTRPDMPPMIAMPTTAGTGSEVGRAGVICLGDDGHKVVIFSPYLMPKSAVCDAELTVDLPPHITAATGIDALTHALEAYVANGYHPFADMFALSALARVGVHLERAVEDGKDLRARHEMMLAASQGAASFQKGLGACHALAHPLSSVAGLHHGLANSLMLPHVIRFNLEAVADRYAVAGEALGARGPGGVAARAEACLARVEAIIDAVGLPKTLSELGVTEDMIERMVPQALTDPSAPGNPRPLTAEAAAELYRAAMGAPLSSS